MRAGVTEFVTAPLTAPELQAALARVVAPRAVRPRRDRSSRSSARRAAWGRPPSASTSPRRSRNSQTGSTLLIDLHLAYGDAAIFLGAEPRFSVLDALDNVHRLDARSSAAWSATRGAASTSWAHRIAPARDRSTRRARPDADRIRVEALPLRRARRAALGRRRCSTCSSLRRGSSSSPTRNWRRCARRRAWRPRSASATARIGSRSSSAASTSSPNIGEDDVERVLGEPGRAHVSEQLPTGARRAERRASGRARQPQQARGRAHRFRQESGRTRPTDAPSEPRSGGLFWD